VGPILYQHTQRTQIAFDTGDFAARFVELVPDIGRGKRAKICALHLQELDRAPMHYQQTL
jgi:hypothetical protein